MARKSLRSRMFRVTLCGFGCIEIRSRATQEVLRKGHSNARINATQLRSRARKSKKEATPTNSGQHINNNEYYK
jgi:hypothetical protein